MTSFIFDFHSPFIRFVLEDHAFVINTDTDVVFFDGNKLNLSPWRYYIEPLSKPENRRNRKKRRVMAIPTKTHAIVVDRGYDNRIFFLYFTKENFKKFRGEPEHQWSYWNDGKRKAFYEDDLSNAVWVKQHAI